MAITKFYMPLESLKPLQERRFWVSGKSVFVLCTLNAPDFFGKTKHRNRLHVMWGSDFIFLPRQRAAIGNEFKQNLLGKTKE